MAIKLLENVGIENTGIGASALNNLITGNKSGIVGKYLNECAFTATGNTIIIDKGLLIICGRQVEIDSIYSITLSSLPSEDVRYQIVIELIREESGEVTASIFARQPSALIQENLLKDGFVYQFELGRVTHKTTGQVTEAVRTADILYGQSGGGGADYDVVIRTQTEFNQLIKSPTWLDAESVALVGQFVYDEPDNSGIKIPDTVKQIHGFNGAKITVTNFKFNSITAKGGLWYEKLPTTNDYSIRDLEVDCTDTGSYGIGFRNCTNLTNCTGTGTGAIGYGFYYCTNLANCTGTGTGTGGGCGFNSCTNLTYCTGTGTGETGYGFNGCTNLTYCTGTGTGKYGFGFDYCTNLANCTGTGTGTGGGIGFYDITYASNCKDGGSTTDMWGGTNKNIDLDTCRKTPVTANNTTLNT